MRIRCPFFILASSISASSISASSIAAILIASLPVQVNAAPANADFSSNAAASSNIARATRINRPENQQKSFQSYLPSFQSYLPGLSYRWWRKFKNPSFCPFVLCGASCADTSGVPRVGAYTEEQLFSDLTPCGLEPGLFSSMDGCCMSSTIESSYKHESGLQSGPPQTINDCSGSCHLDQLKKE